MRFNHRFSALILGIFAVTACMEMETLQDAESNYDFVAEVVPATVIIEDDVDTRTYIDEHDNYSSGVGTMWNANEQIGVYSNYSKNVKYTSTNKSGSGDITFSGICIGTPNYAYYPYSTDNNNVSLKSVKGKIPANQTFSNLDMRLNADYRAGVLDSKTLVTAKFTFTRLMTYWRFLVNVTDTPLVGTNVESITVKINNNRKLSGDFNINLQTQQITMSEFSEGDDFVTLNWTNQPRLQSGNVHAAYMTVLPVVRPGDVLTFTITTNRYIATFTKTAKNQQVGNAIVKYTINLASADNLQITEIPLPDLPVLPEPEEPVVGTHPVLKSMKFTVADNPGKILGRKLVANNSKTSYTTRTEEVCDVDTTNHKISLYLPYLNNRKLVPVFEIPEGTYLCSEGGEIISGETEVDFATYKQIAVVNEVGDAVIYDVDFTNTGLPVVVVNQKSGVVTSESGDYQKASAAWYNATGAAWQPKESDWQMTEGVDNFMVYNADGTSAVTDKSGAIVNEPLLASTRVRGNVSQQMPKKPFAIKLDKKSGVLGMDPHKRWVLLANWSDRTLMRNAVAFDIAKIFNQAFPTDGIAWNPSGQFVELVYNGVHVGNYFLCEQIKIDGSRLDISDPYDKDDAYSGNPADYGYLLESDDAYDETVKFITKTYIPFQFKDDADAGGAMLSYVKGIVNGIDENLYNGNWDAAYASLDLTSAVDFWLIQELTMNGEVAHPKSCYSYIVNDMLHMGPIWDFDWQTFPNVSVVNQYYDNMYTGGSNAFKYEYSKSMLSDGTFSRSSSNPSSVKTNDKSYMWYPMLVKDATFKAKAAERWDAVKGFIAAYADSQIPAMAAKIKKSEAENWSMWPLESGSSAARNRYNTYGLGGGFKGDEAMTFDNAVSTLSSTINTRISGMSYVSNQNWPSVSGTPSYGGSSSSDSNGSGSSWWPW